MITPCVDATRGDGAVGEGGRAVKIGSTVALARTAVGTGDVFGGVEVLTVRELALDRLTGVSSSTHDGGSLHAIIANTANSSVARSIKSKACALFNVNRWNEVLFPWTVRANPISKSNFGCRIFIG